MYRIYFDWNVISSLKNSIKKGETTEILKLINDYPEDFIFPYSPAHLQDLAKGTRDDQNMKYINEDLDLLDKLRKKNLIQFDILDNSRVKPFIGSSRILFKSIVENKDSEIFDFLKFTKNEDDPFLQKIGKQVINIWQNTPVDTTFLKVQEENKDIKDFYNKYFKRLQAKNTVYNLMLDFSEFYEKLKINPEIYNSLSDFHRKQFHLDPKEVSNLKNPFEGLNSIFKKSSLNMNFDKLNYLKSENNKILNSNFTKYAIEYSNLDISGFHPDKLNKKNQYTNLTNDSHHSYYAGYCDCFVSFDKKIRFKSSALYKKNNIETKVFSPPEFINHFSNLITKDLDFDTLFDSIRNTINNNFIEEILEHNFEDSRLYLFRPEKRILSYFNFLYVAADKFDRKTILLRHIHKNFSNFDFYLEWETIIKKCSDIFGDDVNGKNIFTESEKKNFDREKWTGRLWVIQNYLIELVFDNLENSLELFFEEITDRYINRLKKQSC